MALQLRPNLLLRVIRVAGPMAASRMSLVLLSAVDTAFVARIGVSALGGVAASLAVLAMAKIPSLALSTSVQARVSQAKGQGQYLRVAGVVRTALQLALALSFVITVALLAVKPKLGDLLGIPEFIEADFRAHFGVALWFMPLFFLIETFSGSFRPMEARTTMLLLLAVSFINVFLDWALIFGNAGLPRLGVAGASLASGISVGAGAFAFFVLALFRDWALRPKRGVCFSAAEASKLIRIGWPVLIEQAANPASRFTLMLVALWPLGGVAVASFELVTRIAGVASVPIAAFNVAAMIVVAEDIGAANHERAREATIHTVGLSLVCATSIAIAIGAGAHFFLSLLTNDSELIRASIWALRLFALGYIASSVGIAYRGAYRGAGRSQAPMMISLIGRFVIRAPLSRLLGVGLAIGINGVWIATLVSNIFESYALRMYWRRIT